MLSIIQAIIAILLIVCVMFQQRGTALGSAFGGSDSGGSYSNRRGFEKKIYWATIVLGAIFIALAIVDLLM